jgi:hypothetical protein
MSRCVFRRSVIDNRCICSKISLIEVWGVVEYMPDFPKLAFEQLNEADVREEVIAPLLRELGYRSGTENNVVRELPLRYPRQFLGRKDLAKDPVLRGKVDYVLEANSRVRWVIEAKAPDVPIANDAIEQAWTYANHAEVRAVYFALCNGRTLKVFQTNLAPDAGPILTVSYDELTERYAEVCSFLAPESLMREFPVREIEVGSPIGPGLRSVVRITNGLIRYDRVIPDMSPLKDMQNPIVGGAVERDEDGKLTALLTSLSPFRSVQALNDRLGLSSFEMQCNDSALSTDPNHPNIFTYNRTITLPQGSELPDILHWSTVVLPTNVSVEITVLAKGILSDRQFSGRYESRMCYVGTSFVVEMDGTFEIHLA